MRQQYTKLDINLVLAAQKTRRRRGFSQGRGKRGGGARTPRKGSDIAYCVSPSPSCLDSQQCGSAKHTETCSDSVVAMREGIPHFHGKGKGRLHGRLELDTCLVLVFHHNGPPNNASGSSATKQTLDSAIHETVEIRYRIQQPHYCPRGAGGSLVRTFGAPYMEQGRVPYTKAISRSDTIINHRMRK